MKRLLAAACAAMLLTGSLTACSSNKNDTHTTPNTNGTGGTTAGTGYSAPGQVRYPLGADEDRTSYNGMVTNRSRYDGTPDGRYTAYSDGTVAPGRGAVTRNDENLGGSGNNAGSLTGDVARGAGDLVRGTGDAVADIGNGIGNAARDITNW